MGDGTAAPPVEWSAWMRGRIAGCVRRAEEAHRADPGALILCAATRWEERGSRGDWSCDRCRAYSPDGLLLFRFQPRPWLVVAGGLCTRCARAEGWHE